MESVSLPVQISLRWSFTFTFGLDCKTRRTNTDAYEANFFSHGTSHNGARLRLIYVPCWVYFPIQIEAMECRTAFFWTTKRSILNGTSMWQRRFKKSLVVVVFSLTREIFMSELRPYWTRRLEREKSTLQNWKLFPKTLLTTFRAVSSVHKSDHRNLF